MKVFNNNLNKKPHEVSSNAIKKKKQSTNPFELHINKTKFNILGKVNKDDRGLPGISRSKAIKKRERTLLQEYKTRHKSNKFIDQRIGERNPFLDPDQKIALRMVAETKKQFSKKKSLFNLNDDDNMLMHDGKSLTEANLDDNAFSDEDIDDDMHDADFVKRHHFGGDFLTKSSDNKTEDKNKSKKDKIQEIIADSKVRKAESKQLKRVQEDSVFEIDKAHREFLLLLTKSGKEMSNDNIRQSNRDDKHKDYNCSVVSWTLDRSKRSIPVNKLKSDEQLVKEEQLRLEAYQAERKRKMKGDDDDVKPMYQPSADALDDKFYFQKNKKELPVPRKDVASEDHNAMKILRESLKNKRKRKIEECSDEDEECSDKDEECSDEDEECSDEDEETSEESPKKKELCLTYEVPPEYDGFWKILKGYTPEQVSTVMESMLDHNHPRKGHKCKEKCIRMFSYILQTLNNLSVHDAPTLLEGQTSSSYLEHFILVMWKIAKLAPNECGSAFSQVLDDKHEEYRNNRPRIYPYFDTFIFLQVSGMIFPAEDFRHNVMTRVLTFLTQVLSEARVASRREVTSLICYTSLLHTYLSVSGRFIGELSNSLRGVAYLSIPTDIKKVKLLWTQPFKRIGPKADVLVLKNKVENYEYKKFTQASMNIDEEMTDEFKIRALHWSLKKTIMLAKTWEKLPSVRVLIAMSIQMFDKVDLTNYPPCIASSLEDLKLGATKLPSQGPKLRREIKVKSLKMLEPEIEDNFDGDRRRKNNKEPLEIQKLRLKVKREKKGAIREIKRDASFLAKVKLQETLKSDAERKKKVNVIMQGLASQECEFKKFKNTVRS